LKFIRKLCGGKESQQPDKEDEIAFYRSSPSPAQAEPGSEQQLFIKEVAVVLECEPPKVNLDARLVEDLGCADLDVSECVQIAEEI
jgi:hypothetical protein